MKVVFTEWNPLAVIQMAKQLSRRNLEQASQLLIDKIQESMRSGKSGRSYGFHVASATGETPAVLSNKLINALEYKIIDNGKEMVSRIGVNVDGSMDVAKHEYAILLELGTSKMGERSYLRRTLFQNEDEIRRILSG